MARSQSAYISEETKISPMKMGTLMCGVVIENVSILRINKVGVWIAEEISLGLCWPTVL